MRATVQFILMVSILSSMTTIKGQKCPQNYRNMKDLNLQRFTSGRWYVYKTNRLYGIDAVSCAYLTFKNEAVPKVAVNFYYLFGNRYETIPYVSQGQLGFDYNITIPFRGLNFNYTLGMRSTIISTDYSSYAIIYGCGNFGIFQTADVLILSRANYTLKPNSESTVDKILKANKLKTLIFVQSLKTNCNNY